MFNLSDLQWTVRHVEQEKECFEAADVAFNDQQLLIHSVHDEFLVCRLKPEESLTSSLQRSLSGYF